MENNKLTTMITTFEQAKRLKELGFDGKTYRAYWPENGELHPFDVLSNYNKGIELISAPAVSDALQFIRDQFGIECGVCLTYLERFYYTGVWNHKDIKQFQSTDYYAEYPLAESALLDEVLTYLEKKK